MTPSQIFAANQILTIDDAISLIGKKIATTFPVYHMNKEEVREIVILEIISEYDLRVRNNTIHNPAYAEQFKAKLCIVPSEGEMPHYYAHSGQNHFTCGDIDRPVFYVEL